MATLGVAVNADVSAAAAGAHQTSPPAPVLQLLLRFLPFRASRDDVQQQTHKQQRTTRHKLLEELHKNPLWRFTSQLDGVCQPRLAVQRSLPHEAHSALMEYVRLAADAEQQQRQVLRGPTHQYRRPSQVSALEVAAELHALYTLALSSQQQQQQQRWRQGNSEASSSKPLSDAEVLQLLKAYVGLEGAGSQQACSSTGHGTHHHYHRSWDSNTAAAAAVQALYAFAQLADAAQQQQQQQQHLHAAAGQLARPRADRSTATDKQVGSSTGMHGACGSISSCSNTSAGSGKELELQMLLKLAQLSPA